MRCCCSTSRRSARLQRLDVRLRCAHLHLQLLGEKDIDPVQAAPEQRRVGRRGAGHLLGDRRREGEKARQARILDARIAQARLADAIEQAPHGMIERFERGAVGQAQAQRRDLHAREHRPERRRQRRVAPAAIRTGGVTSSITWRSTGSLALATSAERCCSTRGPGARRRSREASIGGWRSSSSSRISACSSSGLRRAAPSLRTLRPDAPVAPAAPSLRPAPAPTPAACSRASALKRARARRLRRRPAEAGARGQDDGAVDAGLDALRLEPRRRRRTGVLQQPRGDAGRRAQDDRAMDCEPRRRTGRVPERGRVDERPKRIGLGRDVGLADQRRREGLQLAQLPFGGAVDQLHRARDLDVDLDARLVHQLEAVPPATRLACRARRAARRVLRRPAAQRLDEGLLVLGGVALQRGDDVGVVHALAAAGAVLRRAEQLDRAGDDARHERRRQRQLVVDEALEERSDRHAGQWLVRRSIISRAVRSAVARRAMGARAHAMKKGCRSSPFAVESRGPGSGLTCPCRPCHPCRPCRRPCHHRRRRTLPSALRRSWLRSSASATRPRPRSAAPCA